MAPPFVYGTRHPMQVLIPSLIVKVGISPFGLLPELAYNFPYTHSFGFVFLHFGGVTYDLKIGIIE